VYNKLQYYGEMITDLKHIQHIILTHSTNIYFNVNFFITTNMMLNDIHKISLHIHSLALYMSLKQYKEIHEEHKNNRYIKIIEKLAHIIIYNYCVSSYFY